jgi:hypothetical protein
VCTIDAEKRLEQLLENRVMLHGQPDQLKAQLQQSGVSGEDIFGMEEDVRHPKEDIDLKNAQTADLQQKILDSDQENKGKTRWDTIVYGRCKVCT